MLSYSLLKLLLLLQLKHVLADFCLQWPFMLIGHARYLHAGRAVHCLVHVVFTGVVLLVMPTPAALIAAIVLVEWVVHFHIDWLKAMHGQATQYDTADRRYWIAFGMDQLAHQLTYIALAWWWLVAIGS